MQAKQSQGLYVSRGDRWVNTARARLRVITGGKSVTSVPETRLRRRALMANTSVGKRILDVAVAFTGLVLLAPLMLLVALAIRLDSRGPVIFRQERYGKGGVPFMILKFRSMSVMESSGAFAQASRQDSRITRVGRFLRSSSIDELPQLFNVLMGDMSLVGPRPHARAMDDHFGAFLPGYLDRHLVRPGLTGLAQVEGFRGPTDTIESIEHRVSKDRDYIRNWSLLRDIRILLRTPLSLFRHPAF
jgi:putative colanic acid biosynthesis UDP-glucose lipid carrier transferase